MQSLPQQVILVALLAAACVSAAAAAGRQAVPSHVRGGPAPVAREVAGVNGVPITSSQLDAAVASLIPMESFHRNVSTEKIAALRQKALRTLVDEELEYQDGVRRSITIPAAEVEAQVTEEAKKYGGRRTFEEAVRRSGATMADVRLAIRRRLTIKKTYDLTVAAKCEVNLDEAMQFFSSNQDRFVEPERLHIYAITVGVDPSSSAERWAAARTRAGEARRELDGGASFGDVAQKYSTDPSKSSGGDMGLVHRGSLSDRFEQVAKNLPIGRSSEVIETLYGYHIIRVSEVRPPEKKTFREVGTGLQKDLKAKRCADLNEAWVARLRASAKVVSLEPVQ